MLPVVGPDTRFQPVYVNDVAEAAVTAVTTDAAAGVYELGGPEVATFRELMRRLLGIIQRRRLVVAAAVLARRHAGLVPRLRPAPHRRPGHATAILTRDQVRLLSRDNVVAPGARGLADLGVDPTAMDAILETYLYAYRPHGQFDAITDTREEPAGLTWSIIPTWSRPSSGSSRG